MAEGGSVRKAKRNADHQITKDDNAEGDRASEEVEAGTFQRASAEVLKTRKIIKVRSRPTASPSSQPQTVTAANPFAGLGSTSASAAAAASPNPFQNVVLSTKPTVSPAEPATTTPAAVQASPVAANGGSGSGSASPPLAAAAAGAGSLPPVGTETTTAAAAADDASKDDKDTKAASASSEAERKEPENGTNQTKDGDGGQRSAEVVVDGTAGSGVAEDAAKMKKPAPSAGVVSFAALGGGGGVSPFKALVAAGTPAIAPPAPLSFGGFGSTSASSLGETAGLGWGLSGSGANLNGGGAGSGAGTAARPVLSFGSSTGTAGSFSSFTSFAAAPGAEGGWGSPPKNDGSGVGADTQGEKKGEASDGSATYVSTKPPLELMDPSEVVNGEELEECTYKARGKLFRLVSKEWVEMGIGNMKVLRPAVDKRMNGVGDAEQDKIDNPPAAARLVMRREAGQQVMINVSLQQSQMRCSMQGEKALLLTCFTPEGPATYLLKLKTPEIAGSLEAAIVLLLPPIPETEGSPA